MSNISKILLGSHREGGTMGHSDDLWLFFLDQIMMLVYFYLWRTILLYFEIEEFIFTWDLIYLQIVYSPKN